MRYRHNYITKVVLRLDFEAVAALRSDARPELSNRIQDVYPVVAGKPTVVLSVNIGPTGSGIQQQNTGMLWEHRRQEGGTKVVNLAPDFLSVEYGAGDYDYFPPVRHEFERIFGIFTALYQVVNVNRIGLRFVNEISLQEGNALDWQNLINQDLITSVKACLLEDMRMLRSMHQLHSKADDISLLFHYGLVNPDYPNPLVRRQFVLDIDCFRAEVTPIGSVVETLTRLNQVCESAFERSIENGLRNIMEIINE